MGLFGAANEGAITEEVEKATNENNQEDNWQHIIAICDKAGVSSEDAKNYLKAIIKRLNNVDPHIAIQAVTLLDACVKNCEKFRIEVASRDFETEYNKLLQKAHVSVSKKLRDSLKRWAENEFKSDPQLNLIPSLYTKLKNQGVDFSATEMSVKKTVSSSKDPNVVESQEEEDHILQAIELSLKEQTASPKSSGSLYPSASLPMTSTTNSTPPKETKKVRALYDFEAAEDNELTFKIGEIIFVSDDSDPNWWKGSNQRGEGLFPANFVTKDLEVEPENFLFAAAKKKVQFDNPEAAAAEKEVGPVVINEEKIDRLLHLLHEADPTNPETDTKEMLDLEHEVNEMGPLIDTELERVDRKHAQLTQLSAELVEALSLYHTLMREPPQFPPKMAYNYAMPAYNGLPPPPPQQQPMQPPPPNMHYGTLPMMPPGMNPNPYMTHDERRIYPFQMPPPQGYLPQNPPGPTHSQQHYVLPPPNNPK